jgi:DNA repair exonuclease SbcCD ATPase subunit
VKRAKAAHEAAEHDLGNAKLLDLTDLKSKIEQCDITLNDARQDVAKARDAYRTVQEQARQALSAWEAHTKMRSLLEGQVSARKEELRVLHFNNTLLKAVRAARPVIGDKLWSLVLGAVSRYFSEMRGERSLVTKTSDGFVVDGHSAATLSGSTLDILGLAVRVALVRTFVPSAPLLILDEPTAAMDEGRTATTLGFLAATGFKQTIIVSHEEATEAVADHLIQL